MIFSIFVGIFRDFSGFLGILYGFLRSHFQVFFKSHFWVFLRIFFEVYVIFGVFLVARLLNK